VETKKQHWSYRRPREPSHPSNGQYSQLHPGIADHVQTWIDERLFGWSRSAKHGTSAWAGTSSHEASHAGTPDDSDEDDAGDLDEVVEFNPSYDETPGSPNLHKSRSRQGSYADLQRLRMTSAEGNLETLHAAGSTSTTGIDALRLRQAHRVRRHSLSDTVPVERIAAVDKRETFEEATHDINLESRWRKSQDQND
jgi:glycerol-3-phosphate O-acyltransferase / dihydroxyacetone phosphate acyltransferase